MTIVLIFRVSILKLSRMPFHIYRCRIQENVLTIRDFLVMPNTSPLFEKIDAEIRPQNPPPK
jgi:hypothetical protein